MNEDDIIEARRRAAEYCRLAEEYCPRGGFLLGDLCGERVMEVRQD